MAFSPSVSWSGLSASIEPYRISELGWLSADRQQLGRKRTHFAPSEFASDFVLLLRTLYQCSVFEESVRTPAACMRLCATMLQQLLKAQTTAGLRTAHPSQLEVIVVPPTRTEFSVHVGVLRPECELESAVSL